MTRLINIDNGGTLTDVCVIDGDGVRYTKTLTTPFDLSRCLFDGLAKASVLLYGEPRTAALLQATDRIRYSTTQGTNALVQRKGPRLGLLTTDPTLVEGLAATVEEETCSRRWWGTATPCWTSPPTTRPSRDSS